MKFLFKASLLVLSSGITLPALAQSFPTPSPGEEIRIEKQDPLVPPLVKVNRITIIGTQYTDAVRLIMHTRSGDEVSPEALRLEQKRIAELGYFSDVTPKLIKQIDGYELVIYLRENAIVKGVQVKNKPQVLSREQILNAFKDLKSQTLNFDKLQQARESIEQQYRDRGYLLAHLEIIQQANGSWLNAQDQLELLMHEGRLEGFLLEGNIRTQDAVIERELSLKAGDLFDQNIFEKDLARLHRLGYFSDIKVQPEAGETAHQFKMRLVFSEEKTTDVGFNFSLNNRDGLLGGVHYTDPNFLGKGQYLNLKVQAGLDFFNLLGSQPQQSQRSFYGRIDFADPWLLPGRTSLGSSLFSERTPLFFGNALGNSDLALKNGLLQTRTGATLSMSRPLFGDVYSPWRGNLSFTAEQIGLTDFAALPQRELSLSKRFSATDIFFNLGSGLSYDSRNLALNPSKGVYGSIAAQPVWGDGSYLKLSGNLSAYIPLLDPGLTLALGLQGGTYVGDHPIYEQFFGAGYSTIRGWQENGTLFGSRYLIGSAEARFPIYDFISGVVFTDIGNFFSDKQAFNQQELPFKYGVGAGLRFQTPMGLLRLDYGIRDFEVLSQGSFLDAGQLHFSIGQKF